MCYIHLFDVVCIDKCDRADKENLNGDLITTSSVTNHCSK